MPAHSKQECNGAVFLGFDALIKRKLLERIVGRPDSEPPPLFLMLEGTLVPPDPGAVPSLAAQTSA